MAGIARLAWPVPERLERQRAELLRRGPVVLGAAWTGIFAGLWRRERVKAGAGHSSPTLAWIGKRILLAGAGWASLWALAPIPASPDWLHLASAALGLGAAVYAGNLPGRL